jgi:hypothetical protein
MTTQLDADLLEPELIRNVRILPDHKLRSRLYDRHATTEAPVSLDQFESDIAASEHDQMLRQVVELQNNLAQRAQVAAASPRRN